MKFIKVALTFFLIGITTSIHAGPFGRKKLKRRQSSSELAQELLALAGKRWAKADGALTVYRQDNPDGPKLEALQEALVAAQEAFAQASREAKSEETYHNIAAHGGAGMPTKAEDAFSTPENDTYQQKKN